MTPKLFTLLRDYRGKQLISDVTAGIIVAIIALPLSIALALASGVEPACGIYTAIAAGFLVALLGGSRVQIAGPTAAFATIVAGVVAANGMEGLFIATVMAGIMLILMGVFKLGSMIKFIPHTITTGFTAGIAVTILIGQIKDFFGIVYADGIRPVETLEKIEANIAHFSTFSWQAIVVGVVSLAILIIYPKFEKKLPPSLIAVVAGALMVAFIPGFDEAVFTIGDLYTIPAGLPKVDFGSFDISLDKITALIPDAFTIAILAAIESLLSCVVADSMVNDKHNSNAELVAQGVANIGSVFFGGIPATGAIARTAANVKNGAKTPVSGMVHSIVLLLVLLVLMPYASLIPMPVIAAILFVVAYNMSEWKKFVRIVKTAPAADILVMTLTFALTVIFDLVVAIAVGLVLSVFIFMKKMADRTRIDAWKYEADRNGLKDVPSDVRVFEIEGALFFGTAEKLALVADESDCRCVILRMRGVTTLDVSALLELENLCKRCQAEGIRVILSHVNDEPMKAIKHSGLYDTVGEENFCPNIDAALAAAGKAQVQDQSVEV